MSSRAIEAATKLSQYYDPELQFEHISLLVRTQKTTLALSILDQLISKNPQYEIIVNKDAELQEDPLLNRYLQQLKDNHLKGIQHKLREHWEEHPLSLLNLDKGLGQKNSHIALQKQQHKMLSNLPPLLQTNEALSSRLIQKYSHSIIADSLDKRKQQYINKIEAQKAYTNRAYKLAQWMLYATVLCLIALGLSYVVSAIAHQFGYYWPINSYIQSVVLGSAIGLLILGTALLHFRPRKLTDLLKQKDQLEELSVRFSALTR